MYKIIVIILFAVSCTSEAGKNVPEEVANLENVSVFQADSEPRYELVLSDSLVLGEAGNILFSGNIDAVANENGEIFVTDYERRQIFQFSRDGEYLRSFGREGNGPGEFAYIQFPNVKGNRLYAYDSGQQRFSVFDVRTGDMLRNFKAVYEEPGEKGSWTPGGYHIGNDGRITILLKRFFRPEEIRAEMDNRVMIMDAEGNIIEKDILNFENSPSIFIGDEFGIRTPFMAKTMLQFGRGGGLILGSTDRLLIRYYNSRGEYRHAFFYDVVRYPVTKADIEEATSGMSPPLAQLVDQADLPDAWPAWESMLQGDEGQIWISLHPGHEAATTWWVLNQAGEKLAEKRFPSRISVSTVRDGYLYASAENEEGSRVIVRWRVELR